MSLVISRRMMLRQQKMPTSTSTADDTTTTMMIPVLLLSALAASSSQPLAPQFRLAQTISQALSAVSISVCLMPLTDSSGKLLTPVLVSTRRHSIIWANQSPRLIFPNPSCDWILAEHSSLFFQSQSHNQSNLFMQSNHLPRLFCYLAIMNRLYCLNCSQRMKRPLPDSNRSISKVQQVFCRMHSLSKHPLHSIVWQKMFRLMLSWTFYRDLRKLRRNMQFLRPEADRKMLTWLVWLLVIGKFTLILGLVSASNFWNQPACTNKIEAWTLTPVPSSAITTPLRAQLTSSDAKMTPWAPRLCALIAFLGQEQPPSLTTIQVGRVNCLRASSSGWPHRLKLVMNRSKLMGLLQWMTPKLPNQYSSSLSGQGVIAGCVISTVVEQHHSKLTIRTSLDDAGSITISVGYYLQRLQVLSQMGFVTWKWGLFKANPINRFGPTDYQVE